MSLVIQYLVAVFVFYFTLLLLFLIMDWTVSKSTTFEEGSVENARRTKGTMAAGLAATDAAIFKRTYGTLFK